MHKFEFRAMGTDVLIAVDNDEPEVGTELEQVPGWFETWEQTLSRFRAESELNALNSSAGRRFQASPVLWEVMQASLAAYEASAGLISPALLPALERAGYTQSFDNMLAAAAPSDVVENANFDTGAIKVFPETRSIVLPAGMRLDFGGVAKGWAAQQALERLKPLGPALVDAGGDISVSALDDRTECWQIAIKDPLNGDPYGTISLCNGGVATSGRDRRRWLQGGRWQHHIVDPRTGQPAATDLLTVTVIADTVMQAEMAAKTVLILGSEAGFDWIAARDGFEALGFFESGEVVISQNFERYTSKEKEWI